MNELISVSKYCALALLIMHYNDADTQQLHQGEACNGQERASPRMLFLSTHLDDLHCCVHRGRSRVDRHGYWYWVSNKQALQRQSDSHSNAGVTQMFNFGSCIFGLESAFAVMQARGSTIDSYNIDATDNIMYCAIMTFECCLAGVH